MMGRGAAATAIAVLMLGPVVWQTAAAAQETVVYKCPGNLYTSTLSAKEAADKGCKQLEGGSVTVIQGPPIRRAPAPSSAESNASRPSDARVDPADQKARDADKRRILEGELRREQQHLATLQAEYNNGQPERQGNEKNYQKYLDRTAELKAGVERSQSDVEALKRELSKLGPADAGTN